MRESWNITVVMTGLIENPLGQPNSVYPGLVKIDALSSRKGITLSNDTSSRHRFPNIFDSQGDGHLLLFCD